MAPFTSNGYAGAVVPIPTLLPEIEIGELPSVELPVNTGIVFVVPPPVVTVVCAATPTASEARNVPMKVVRLHIVQQSFRRPTLLPPSSCSIPSLLQCDQHFDHTGSGIQLGHGLADYCAQHPAAIRSLHRVAGGGGCDEQIAHLDGTVFRAYLGWHNAHNSHGHFVWTLLCGLRSVKRSRLGRVDAGDGGGISFNGLEHLSWIVRIQDQHIARLIVRPVATNIDRLGIIAATGYAGVGNGLCTAAIGKDDAAVANIQGAVYLCRAIDFEGHARVCRADADVAVTLNVEGSRRSANIPNSKEVTC